MDNFLSLFLSQIIEHLFYMNKCDKPIMISTYIIINLIIFSENNVGAPKMQKEKWSYTNFHIAMLILYFSLLLFLKLLGGIT